MLGARPRAPFRRFLLADRNARVDLAGAPARRLAAGAGLSDRVPTPVETAQFIWEEFRRPFNPFQPWSILSNQLVFNSGQSVCSAQAHRDRDADRVADRLRDGQMVARPGVLQRRRHRRARPARVHLGPAGGHVVRLRVARRRVHRGGLGDAGVDRPRDAGVAVDPARSARHVWRVPRSVHAADTEPDPPLDGRCVDRRDPTGDHGRVGVHRVGGVVRQRPGGRLPRPVLLRQRRLQRLDGLGRDHPRGRDHDRPRRSSIASIGASTVGAGASPVSVRGSKAK